LFTFPAFLQGDVNKVLVVSLLFDQVQQGVCRIILTFQDNSWKPLPSGGLVLLLFLELELAWVQCPLTLILDLSDLR
jgi:hypothetical protein